MSHPYADIPELARCGPDRGLVRIPMEQDVPLTQRVRALIDTPEFQRLGRISQLGLTARVYPGATHTRFEHALGVFHNALQYLWQLGKDRRFCEAVDVHHAEVLMAAALLHDLGHWPFCHPIEDIGLRDLPPHEEFAATFLAPERELAAVLRQQWKVEPSEVLDVLLPRRDTPPLRLLRSILSGPIDIDKMDYLDRDSLHAGVPYGRNFDRHRLIESLVVNAAGDGLAITSKGKTAAELMVFARYVMFSEVYWHHAVRAATSMFARAFYDLYGDMDVQELFQLAEPELIAVLRQRSRNLPCEKLLEGIFGTKRRLYKRVREYSHYQSQEMYERLSRRPYDFLVRCAGRLAERLSPAFSRPLQPQEIIIDAPPPHREIEFAVDIYFAKEERYRPLHAVSPVVEALAQRQFDDYVKQVRIFADPSLAPQLAANEHLEDHLQATLQECEQQPD